MMTRPPRTPFGNHVAAMLLSPLGIVVMYGVVGGAWILWSDHLLHVLFDQSAAITRYQTAKGLGYVVVTATLLYLGIQAGQRRLRRAAEALANADADQRTLLAEASDAIFVIDQQGLVTLANRKACELLGRPENELVGGDIEQLLAPIDPARLQEATAIMAERGAFIEEHSITRPDQSQVQAEFHFARLSDGRIQAIARDITERRRLEGQLMQAQKMEVVGRMAGGVAHDFNNLLTIILGTAGNARLNAPDGSELAQDLDTIATAGSRGAEITRQLLSFSRKHPTAAQTVDLSEVVDRLVPMAGRLTGRGITIATDTTRGLPPVAVDPALLEQALLNLVANARDAMPTGGTITLRTVLDRSNNGHAPHVVVAVRDTGTGMDAATRDRIFEPFFTTKPEGQGTGLGLPMVQEFASRSGGRVTVDSAVGRGTTVSVRLPAGSQ
jgi:two-component system, cell cycle sensor histidine kinase and response regulator CckA